MKVVVSNGSNQFHLVPLSVDLARMRILAGMITAGWPSGIAGVLARPFRQHKSVARFFNRRDAIPEELVYACNAAEALLQLAMRLRPISEATEQRFSYPAFYLYAAYAAHVVKQLQPQIYHWRSCYGLGSVRIAEQMGVVSVCDHSIAHPGVLQYMIDNEGRWPNRIDPSPIHPLHRLMWRDLRQAKHVIVNSDFVKETCVYSGIAKDIIHVAYLGVDRKFARSIPTFDAQQVRDRANHPFLYVGGVQKRKGIITLAKAYLGLDTKPNLNLIGGREPTLERLEMMRDFFNQKSVLSIGILPRAELAGYMINSPVFIFPSYCEGSARVIFEAMACGCFIITTPNSGSIVRDGANGLLVPAGDHEALAKAITWALENAAAVAQIGWSNAELVRKSYQQQHYAEKVASIYYKLMQDTSAQNYNL